MNSKLILTGLATAVLAVPAGARMLATAPQPSETFSPVLSLTIGGGVEYEHSDDERQWEFPWLLEYNLTEVLRVTVESKLVYLDSKGEDGRTVGGWGDTETSAQWEILRERRYRPAMSVEGIIEWATATHNDIEDPGEDYTLGLIASKDFVYCEMDLGLHYTWVGEAGEHDRFELTVASEIPINHRLAVLLESVTEFETGSHGRNTTEGTAGIAWLFNEHLKLEFGGTLEEDGTWKAIFAWEWSFAGED